LKKILFLVAHRPDRSPGQRFRFEQYLNFFRDNGYQFEFSFLISEKDDKFFYKKGHYLRKLYILLKSIFIRFKDLRRAKQFDLIFIYREAVMFGSIYFEKQLKKKKIPIILDFDDAIWLLDVSAGNRNLKWLKNPEKTSKIISLSDLIIVGNNYLANYSKQFNKNTIVIPTTLDTDKFKRDTPYIEKDIICIGWTGSATTLKHLELAIPFLKSIYEKYKNKVRFKVIADVPFHSEELNFEFAKWNKDTEIEDLCDIDIGIMPLPDDKWAKGKCGFKGLQYMAMGIPAIMSPVGVNTQIITDGINGFLAKTVEEWISKLSLLVESFDLRLKFGNEGKKTVEDRYSFNSNKMLYLKNLNNLIK